MVVQPRRRKTVAAVVAQPDRTATSLAGVVLGPVYYSFFGVFAVVVQKPENHRGKPEWRWGNQNAVAVSRLRAFVAS